MSFPLDSILRLTKFKKFISDGYLTFIPADEKGPFKEVETNKVPLGTLVRVVGTIAAHGYVVKTLDGKWKRIVYSSDLEELSPLEQLAAEAEDIKQRGVG